MNQWSDDSMNRWIKESVNQWSDESTNLWNSDYQWINESVNLKQWNPVNSDPMNLWTNESMQFFDLVLQKCSDPRSFCVFLGWNPAPAVVSCAFLRPHLSKVLWGPQLFVFLVVKSSTRYGLVHFLSTTYPDRGSQTRKQRPRFGGPHKNTAFRTRDCFYPWIHAFLDSYMSQLLDDGWLTWWCGWHDGVSLNANHDQRP